MDRCISVKDAKIAFVLKGQKSKRYKVGETWELNCEEICEVLDSLPNCELKWIPCSEKFPEEDQDVLVTVHFDGMKIKHNTGYIDHIKSSNYVDIARYFDGEWSSASDEYKVARNKHKVIAWCPLPKPYKEDKE